MRRALLLATLAATACAVGPDYAPPVVETPSAWRAPGAAPGADPGLAAWWRKFDDPLLTSLVERALSDSPDVRIAGARVAEARAGVAFAAGAGLPEAGAGAGAYDQRASGNAPPLSQMPPAFTFPRDSDLYRSGFTASWEFDAFGRVARSVEAAEADLAAAEEAARGVRVALAAEIGRQHVELRGLQRQRAVAALNLEAEARTRDLGRRRKEAGAASGLDLTRAEAAVAGTKALLPALDAAIARSSHALAILLDAQRVQYAAEVRHARSQAALAADTIFLMKALGGGWSPDDPGE